MSQHLAVAVAVGAPRCRRQRWEQGLEAESCGRPSLNSSLSVQHMACSKRSVVAGSTVQNCDTVKLVTHRTRWP